MTTRRAQIVKRYTALEAELKKYIDVALFPSLDDIDLADVVFLITTTFLGVDSQDQYTEKIRDLVASNGIKMTDETLSKVTPMISDFVHWLKAL